MKLTKKQQERADHDTRIWLRHSNFLIEDPDYQPYSSPEGKNVNYWYLVALVLTVTMFLMFASQLETDPSVVPQTDSEFCQAMVAEGTWPQEVCQ